MRVDIKGDNPLTTQELAIVLNSLNEEFGEIGLRVKNMTCYVRFQDNAGETVEPLRNGAEITKKFVFRKTRDQE